MAAWEEPSWDADRIQSLIAVVARASESRLPHSSGADWSPPGLGPLAVTPQTRTGLGDDQPAPA